MPSKRLRLTQILVIFVLPVLILYFKILPPDWRMVLLAISSLLIYGIIRHENWTYEDMGIRHDNFKKALPFYLFFTVLGLIVLFFINYKVNITAYTHAKLFAFDTFIFFLPSSFFQEFAFRSFLMPRLKRIFNNNYYVIFVNALLFAFIHIIYTGVSILMPFLFILGIFLAWLYQKYPNLVLISLAHAVLNVTAVALGFFAVS
jgi:membrane protease YdiL (CAAX protease family)